MRTSSISSAPGATRRLRLGAVVTAALVPLSLLVGLSPAQAQSVNRSAAAVDLPLLPGNERTDDVVLFSASASGVLDGVAYDDADVLRLDRSSGRVALAVDGSDLALTGGIDAVAALTDGSLLLSSDRRFTHPELGAVEPEDVITFRPRSLGADTTGTLEWLLDGSDVGLDGPVADVDAVAVSPDGRLLVTPYHPTVLQGFLAKGHDLVALADATYGAESAGRWERYLVGTDLGLRAAGDAIGGASVNAATGGSVFLSTRGRTTPPAVPADRDQVLRCEPTSLAPAATSCGLSLFEDLDVALDALHVGTAAWLDEGCEAPWFDVAVTSHAEGESVDTGKGGTGTGSVILRGRAPVAATAVMIAVAGETGPAEFADTGCGVTWEREVVAAESGPVSFTVTSNGPTGVYETTLGLVVRAPDADDVLVQPTFAGTPQLHDRLRSYDPSSGVLVFDGDVTDVLDPGDGLGGGPSVTAPEGYLRIILGVVSDGATSRVATRQAGLTEFVRQVEVDYQAEPGDVEPLVFSTEDGEDSAAPALAQATLSEPQVAAMSAIPVGGNTDVQLEFQLDPGVRFQLDIDWSRGCWLCVPKPSLQRLWFEGSMELKVQAVVLHKAAEITTGERPFGPRYDDYRLGGLTVPTPIGVPIVITFEAESQAFYELSLSAAVKLEYGVALDVVAGFEYDARSGGRGTYRDADFKGPPPVIDAVDLGLVAQAAAGLETDFEVLLYGQGGIEIEARPQLEVQAVGDVTDREIKWDLKLVVPLEGGLEIEVRIGPIGWEKEFGNLRFVTLSLVLFKGTIPLGDGDGDTDGPSRGLGAMLAGPPGAFPGQVFDYAVTITNKSTRTATGVVARVELPEVGSFVSSVPIGTPAYPAPGSTYVVDLPDIAAGSSATARIRWRAPTPGDVVARASAVVTADGFPVTRPVTSDVAIGLEGFCNPCGATAAGTGLRNRAEGEIRITDIPEGATVTRAVLHWGVLYSGPVPRDSITLQGTPVRADVAATVSGNLCWGESATIGYTADVTSLVTGNGTYRVSDPPRGITRPDSQPAGVLPYTDGASLIVFYVGGGASDQVLSDFTYSTNTAGSIVRSFDGISSRGLGATLTLAGPDGQGNGGEVFTVSGAGTPITLVNTWDGSDPQQSPSFAIGNLWDTDTYDVSQVLPEGQTSLTLSNSLSGDCIGVGASVLEVAQQ